MIFDQYSDEEFAKAIYNKRSGFFQDCFTDREAIKRGEYAAICDVTSMKMAMAYDFRYIIMINIIELISFQCW